MPKGRISFLPGFGIQSLRNGLDLLGRAFPESLNKSLSRSIGVKLFTPSTPAVFLPVLS